MKPFLFTILALSLVICQAAENSSLKIRLTSSGLAYAGEEAVKELAAAIPSLQIPDIDNGDIKATNFKITKFSPPKSQVNLQAPSSFSWSLTNADIRITTHVEACKKIFGKKICASIDLELDASGVNLQIAGTLGRKPEDPDRPTFLAANAETKIGDLSIKTEGGALGWIINLFSSIIASQVKPDIEKSLSDQLQKYILVNGNSKLANMAVKYTLDSRYNLNYGMATDPVITAGYLELNIKGEVTCPSAPTVVSPYPQTPLAFQIMEDYRMVYILFSDKLANDLLYFAHELNQTNYLITDSVPEFSDYLKLHCGEGGVCIGTYINETYMDTMYKNVDAAQIYVTTTIPPTIRVDADGSASFNVNVTLNISAPSPQVTSSIMIGTMAMKADLKISMNVSLGGHINITKMDLNITESQFEDYAPAILENSLMKMIKKKTEEKIKEIFASGVPIPNMGDVVLSKTNIRLLERTVQLESDVNYVPH